MVRVAALDMAHSERRTAVVVGPLAIPSRTELIDRYAALARRGPLTRLCLEPSVQTNRWRTVPIDPTQVISSVEDTTPAAPLTDVLRHVRAQRTDDVSDGIRIACVGDRLVIDFCHGLGEVAFVHLVLDVLLGVVDPADPALLERYERCKAPLLHAGLRTFGRNVRRLPAVLGDYRRRTPPAARAAASGGGEPFHPSPATRFIGIPADAVTELRRRRDVALPGVSLVTLCTHALWAGFFDSGLAVDHTVKIPFDVRRYLAPDTSTLGPFTAGLDFTIGPGGPARLQADIDRDARNGRPVANIVLGTLKARHRRTPSAAQHPGHPRVQLLHSNVGTPEHADQWPFTDLRAAHMLVASDPVGPEGVTVTSSSIAGNLWLTAEFHGNVFDAGQIETALAGVVDRMMGYLPLTHR